MSTADEIMLRAQAMRRRMDQVFDGLERWNTNLQVQYLRSMLWRGYLQAAADATRYQLTWNGKP